MDNKTYGIFGGSFNPPGLHHILIVKELVKHFNHVIVLPCGPRPDKPSTNSITTEHRLELCKIAFSSIPGIQLDLSDLSLHTYTPTYVLLEKHSQLGEIWIVIGSDLILGGKENNSEIQRSWFKGKQLWSEAKFFILNREGSNFDKLDLPPNHRVLNLSIKHSSKEIRDAITNHHHLTDLVPQEIASYIKKNNLYS